MSVVVLAVIACLVILCHLAGVPLDLIATGLGASLLVLALLAWGGARIWFHRQRLRLWREWHYGANPRLVAVEPPAGDLDAWSSTDARAAELHALGFQPAGQYQERDTPYPILLRVLLSGEGRVFAVIIPGLPRPLVTLISVLGDRTQVRTSDAELRVFPIPDGYPEQLFPALGSEPIDRLLQHHAAHVQGIGRFEALRTFGSADFPRVWSDHYRRLVAHLVALGWFAPAGDGTYRATPEGIHQMERGFQQEWSGRA